VRSGIDERAAGLELWTRAGESTRENLRRGQQNRQKKTRRAGETERKYDSWPKNNSGTLGSKNRDTEENEQFRPDLTGIKQRNTKNSAWEQEQHTKCKTNFSLKSRQDYIDHHTSSLI
jgi:hypothetical protein